MQPELDRPDLRLLEVLQEHGVLSAAELAERVGLTASTCWRRVTRLEELGRGEIAMLLQHLEETQVGAVQFR